ncbi:cuticle protein 16.8 [Tetranychus urticae]|uniref:Uncharacterized protein n=1 Tax=Tetranychus urticae TaxID=32264 RepID=T1KF92_TETUR|nr:cuticle protein 16.8 [Tetranychus urticae]
MLKELIGITLITIVTASPAYYGYTPAPKYSPTPKDSYAIPTPSYTHHKQSYSEPTYENNGYPYSFGYDIDDGYGNNNHRMEEGDEHGNKRGSYGYTDAYGVYRKVDYIADDYGFRATVTTNEPGTANSDPADVKMYSKEPPATSSPSPAPVYAAPAYLTPSYAPSYGYKPYSSYSSKPSYYEEYKRPYEYHNY